MLCKLKLRKFIPDLSNFLMWKQVFLLNFIIALLFMSSICLWLS